MITELTKLTALSLLIAEVPESCLTIERWDAIDYSTGAVKLHPAVWAGMDPEFQDAGFNTDGTEGQPMYGSIIGFNALYEFFDIDKRLVDMMFKGHHYPDPRNVTKLDIVTRIDHVAGYIESGLYSQAA